MTLKEGEVKGKGNVNESNNNKKSKKTDNRNQKFKINAAGEMVKSDFNMEILLCE